MPCACTIGFRILQERFAETLEKRQDAEHSIAAGREFVQAYVEFTHYVERLHTNALSSAAHETPTGAMDLQGSHQH